MPVDLDIMAIQKNIAEDMYPQLPTIESFDDLIVSNVGDVYLTLDGELMDIMRYERFILSGAAA